MFTPQFKPVLYPKQRKILKFIENYIAENGYSPTLTEIQEYLGVRALSTVHEHLMKLEDKGYLERADRGRGIRLKITRGAFAGELLNVPMVGFITAGEPIDAIEENDEFVPFPVEFIGNKKVYCLKVRGDSMVDGLIADGDIVICEKTNRARNGEVVVALFEDGTATLKRYYKEKNAIRLQPDNPNYKPIRVRDLEIQGRVVGVFRKY